MLNGVLIDEPMDDTLLNQLSIVRWRLRTHIHDDPKKCIQCIQDILLLGQQANAIFDYIDELKDKLAQCRKSVRHVSVY